MAKIVYTGSQYLITIPKDLMKLLRWNTEEVFVGKVYGKDIIFIEKIETTKTRRNSKSKMSSL